MLEQRTAAELHQAKVAAAVSLIDDNDSFQTRLGASKFLAANPAFQESAIGRIWQCIYTEKRPEVVAELINTLGNLKERGADSIPLIAYHLQNQNEQVVEAATRALCQLSASVEHALAPLLTANLHGDAFDIRHSFICQAFNDNSPKVVMYREQLRWIRNNDHATRAEWLNNLPLIGICNLTEPARARFLLLYADPTGDHVWGCLKVIWQSQKASPNATTVDTERSLSACEGSFFKEVTSYGEPIRTRFLAKALAQSRPFTASLAYPLANVELDGAQALSFRIKATAVQLAPHAPPPSSLKSILEGLWYESEGALRTSAIDCLIELLPELGQESAKEVINDVFEFLHKSTMKNKVVMGDVARIITTANNTEVGYILDKTEELLNSSSSKASKIFALANLAHLRYSGPEDPLAARAKSMLARTAQSKDRGICNMSRVTLTNLLARERHIAGLANSS